MLKKNTLVLRTIAMLLFTILFASPIFSQDYQFGFETGAADSWVNNTSTTGNAVVSTVKRTGAYSFLTAMSSAGTNRGLKRSNITVSKSINLYAIAWVKASNTGTTAGMTLSGGTTGLTNTNISNTAFTQVSVAYANSSNTTRELRLYYSNSNSKETVYLDDVIIYESTNSSIDLVSPNAPVAVSGTYSGGNALLNWTSGGDDGGSGATGVQSTMILKYTGTGTATAPVLNNQAIYAVGDAPATGWQVIKTDGGASGGSVNAGAITANTTFAVYHRDLACNWSAPATTTINLVSGTLPTVSTTVVSAITTATATSGGNVTGEGSTTVTVKGIVFGPTPSTTSNPTNNGTGVGSYTSSLSSLTANTKYYYRAYATNGVGTAYGTENNFTTLPNAPVISTATAITTTGFTANWSAPATQGAEAFTYTIEVDDDNTFASVNATYANLTTLSQAVSGLANNITYYYRVKAINATGASAYSATSAGVLTATPTIALPTVSTTTITAVTVNSAASGGNVTADGGASVTAKGVVYATTANPTTANSKTSNGTGTGSYTSAISGLTANQTYYVRAYAINSAGTAYGDQQSFTTMAAEPTTKSSVSFGTLTSSGIVVNFSGGNGTRRIVVARPSSSVSFTPTDGVAPSGVNAAYSSATDQGNSNRIVYDGTGSTVTVTGLSAATTYYFAVYEYNTNLNSLPNYYATAGTGNAKTASVTVSLAIAFNNTLTTPYLNPPYVSGVISDPTDPSQINGIVVAVTNNGNAIAASDYTLTASSSKTSVVPNANVVITQADGNATVKIIPAAVGYAKITLTLKLNGNSSSKTLAINYAASAASATPVSAIWHTGYSDASGVVALDDDYMVVCDDEKNNLYVVNRKQSGLPVKTFYFGDNLGLTDGSAGNYSEVDVEACVRSKAYPTRVYWTGSMSNAGSSNKYKPNSNTLFATTITGTGTNTSFAVVGHYAGLRQQLVTWGDAHGYSFTSSTASGHDAKTIDGFNVEGMCLAPDNTTLYIGFRAPLVPTSNRTKALIAPLSNFETWFNNGNPSGNPTLGAPIELDLGKRGIRDIVRLSNGDYIIVAGNYAGDPLTGALYKWTGNASDKPVQITAMNITNLNAEACVEVQQNGVLQLNKLQVISDNGGYEFYNDGTEAKDLSEDNYKKYEDDIITVSGSVLRPSIAPVVDLDAVTVYPNPVRNGNVVISVTDEGVKQARLIDVNGNTVKQFSFTGTSATVNVKGLAAGNYQVLLINAKGKASTRKIIIL
ncbi:fibronectin type III domain-containing protein [Ferruginibacter albus]|uniref:fibronectin type III domain-containing protein n=1 Tax=Ferruginibacter albus TaxID=2875540 RepID=UPI001CC40E99|nr:fibronectin type III domain-containing protein [Ferruginibacter albus]UAY53035.1 fibronectin type III domain-containing protein [Ferruginibacter albus]